MDHLETDHTSKEPSGRTEQPSGQQDSNTGAGADRTPDAAEAPKPSDGGGQRRRGSRGGQGRRGGSQQRSSGGDDAGGDRSDRNDADHNDADRNDADRNDADRNDADRNDVEMPEPLSEGRPSAEASEKALVKKPKIGDTMPIPTTPPPGPAEPARQPAEGGGNGSGGGNSSGGGGQKRRRRRGGRGGSGRGGGGGGARASSADASADTADAPAKQRQSKGGQQKKNRRGRGRGRGADDAAADASLMERRRGRERDGKPLGRYFMAVQVRPGMSQVAVVEGRSLIEHYVSRPADDVTQIHGNIYVGKVQNVLPGMEAAFVDIATPKNAVLYRGDVQYDPADIEQKGSNPRIEDILKNKQLIVCQVTKNPIAHKGARLTQEVSLPGRFVVLIPNSKTYGISKRLPDDVRKRLRGILDRVKPAEHGLIVRTAAEHATEDELRADMTMLLDQWDDVAAKAAKAQRPTLLYREPELAVRVIREEFNSDYRGVVIDDRRLYEEVKAYVEAFSPELADRIEYYDPDKEKLSLFERHHIHEQVHKALDRKVWLPSGGSLIIEHTEALSVIDVNTGKNVGKSNLEETVFHNNMEAAEEIAKQLRLRDIGGIIVIDFIDMEIRDNRAKVVETFRNALARDKTRSQVFDITELGLVEMTRKRIGEGLLTEYSEQCPDCEGRGVLVDYSMLD
jgi:ribonuclease E